MTDPPARRRTTATPGNIAGDGMDYRIDGPWSLPVRGPAIAPVDAALLDQFRDLGAATVCAKLHQLGVHRTFIDGPVPRHPGQRVVGRAVTLQFMPQREDILSGVAQEYVERATALWAALDHVEPNDVLVVQAYGSTRTGVLGEMLVQHLANRGGVGLVADGRIRDAAHLDAIGLPIWATGATPHYASQGELFPWAYHVPVAVGGVLVLPGDLIIADDDGAVLVPIGLADAVIEASSAHADWEDFSRLRLQRGGALRRYYPLDEIGEREYREWVQAGRQPT
jgi:regulator of RNase E activity RraA